MTVRSVSIAKERLKTLLVSDRMKCTPDLVDRLSNDLYHTVAKYIEIRPEDFEIEITRTEIHINYDTRGKKN